MSDAKQHWSALNGSAQQHRRRRLRNAVQTARREVSNTLVARAALEEQIVVQAERLKAADLRYQNGVASSLEVLDAQRELFSTQQSLVQARLQRLTNAIDLYRALGGGLSETAGK